MACKNVSWAAFTRAINTHEISNTHGLETDGFRSAIFARFTGGNGPGSPLANLVESLLDQGISVDNLAVGVDVVQETTLNAGWVIRLEERAMHSDLQLDGAIRHPLDVCLGLALLVEHSLDASNLARLVLLKGCGLDRVGGVKETDSLSRGQPEVALDVLLAEIGSVDVDSLCQADLVVAKLGVLGRVRNIELLGLLKVFDGDSDRVQDEHQTGHRVFKVTANTLLKSGDLDESLGSGDTKLVDKGQEGTRGDTSTSNGNQSVEARVVPASDNTTLDQLLQCSLAHDGSANVESAYKISC